MPDKVTSTKLTPKNTAYDYTHYTNAVHNFKNQNSLSQLSPFDQSEPTESYRKNMNYLIVSQSKRPLDVHSAIKEVQRENPELRKPRIVSRNDLITRPRMQIETVGAKSAKGALTKMPATESTEQSRNSRRGSVMGSTTESQRRIIERAEKDRIARHTPKKLSKTPANTRKTTKKLEKFLNSVFC
eukprot:TRINITY_DN1274_c0_g2_i2.p1 TRINITY_DN1274_c0_g2~~TRINITY_DN1274_c0_g2_i2.p1  ORF type:complete len:185 (+),score=18.43 TRINITY_DN1274_c0_g2_i2:440-994(+)